MKGREAERKRGGRGEKGKVEAERGSVEAKLNLLLQTAQERRHRVKQEKGPGQGQLRCLAD